MTEPTDAEIVAVMRDGYNCRYNDEQDHIDFARAVLEKWGRPAAVVGEPVAWLDPWTGAKATTDYDAYGKHGIPLYTAPQPVVREPLTDERLYEEKHNAVPQLFDLARDWADNKIHSYQFAHEAERIVNVVARRVEAAHGITQRGGSNAE